MDASQRAIERKLADGNAHASGALISQPKNALSVADHDAANLVEPGVGENLRNSVLMGIAQKQASRFTPNLTESLESFPHSRGVDQGKHALDVGRQQGVKEGLVCVLKI